MSDLNPSTRALYVISVAAEIVATHWGGTGGRLSQLTERIHHDHEVGTLSPP